MGEYVLVTNKLRDPLESDAQRRAREKRAFGSPYAGVRENEVIIISNPTIMSRFIKHLFLNLFSTATTTAAQSHRL